MAREYTREIYLYINGKQINNDIKSIRAEMQLLVNEQAKMRIRGPRGENQVSERHSERTFRAIEKHEPVVERNHGRHGRLVQPVPGCGGSCNCNHCGLPGSELYPPRPSLKQGGSLHCCFLTMQPNRNAIQTVIHAIIVVKKVASSASCYLSDH